MGTGVRTRKSHRDVTRPRGPKGRLAKRSEVNRGPLPNTEARDGGRGLAGGSELEGRPNEPGAQGEAGGEPRRSTDEASRRDLQRRAV